MNAQCMFRPIRMIIRVLCRNHVMSLSTVSSSLRFGLVLLCLPGVRNVIRNDLELLAVQVESASNDTHGQYAPIVAGDTILHKLLRFLVILLCSNDDDFAFLADLLLHRDLLHASGFAYMLNVSERIVLGMSTSGEVQRIPF